MTPTSRTLEALRSRGLIPGMVERFIKGANVRVDLFGIIDIVALDHKRGFIGVQSTGESFSAHKHKLLVDGRDACINWLLTPGLFLELYGWRKIKMKIGGKRMIFKPRYATITLEDGELVFTEFKQEDIPT